MKHRFLLTVLLISLSLTACTSNQSVEVEPQIEEVQSNYIEVLNQYAGVVNKQVFPEYKDLYKANNDMVGYLYLSEEYRYPILQSKDNQNFYSDHNFYKEDDKSGAIFINANCSLGEIGICLIYGHNMRDNSMFGSLDNWEEKDYFESHRTIQIDTLYARGTYEVVAVMQTSLNENFKYYEYVGSIDESLFEDWKVGCKPYLVRGSLDALNHEDTIVELSTCAYHKKDGRLVLILKRIE